MSEKQACGHPIECQHYEDDDGYPTCEWCEEVAVLSQNVNDLKGCLEKNALVVNGGTLHLSCPTIGYLAVYEGTINQNNGLSSIVLQNLREPHNITAGVFHHESP